MAKKLRLLLIIRMLAFTSFAYSFKLTGSCTGGLTTTAGNSLFHSAYRFPRTFDYHTPVPANQFFNADYKV